MGNNNSIQQTPTNNEIMANINKLFSQHAQGNVPEITIHSLDMSDLHGGCNGVKCTRNRFAPYEQQLGGMISSAHKQIALTNGVNVACKFAPLSGGNGDDYSDLEMSDDEQQGGGLTATSNTFMSEIGKMTNLSVTSPSGQTGGNLATSNAFASEIANMGQLSVTSMANMNGGCGCDKPPIAVPTMKTTSILDSLTDMSVKQQGGCGCGVPSATSTVPSQLLGGGFKQTSEEMNIMPFYSSTSGTEYYNNMQKAHRYA